MLASLTVLLRCMLSMLSQGKSHSMSGTPSDPGLIPRTLGALFSAVADRVACAEQDWESTSISFSFFELYNEKIYVRKRRQGQAC